MIQKTIPTLRYLFLLLLSLNIQSKTPKIEINGKKYSFDSKTDQKVCCRFGIGFLFCFYVRYSRVSSQNASWYAIQLYTAFQLFSLCATNEPTKKKKQKKTNQFDKLFHCVADTAWPVYRKKPLPANELKIKLSDCFACVCFLISLFILLRFFL